MSAEVIVVAGVFSGTGKGVFGLSRRSALWGSSVVMASDDNKFLTGGAGLFPFEQSQEQERGQLGDLSKYFPEIEGHVERHIGAVELLYEDTASISVPINIMVVPATSDRRFHYLVTSGMSNQPMHLNDKMPDAKEWRYAELVMALPKYWPIDDDDAMQKPEWYYPIEHLKFLAQIPERFKSWLSTGHSVPNTRESKPIGPKCEMTGFVLDKPILAGEAFHKMRTWDGNILSFYAVYPVFTSEMQYKLENGYTSLMSKFRDNNVMEIFDPVRDNVVSSGWRRFFNW